MELKVVYINGPSSYLLYLQVLPPLQSQLALEFSS